MFVDFDRIFKNVTKTVSKIPERLLQYISKDLPVGTKYEVDGEGNCYISTDDDCFSIGGFFFETSDEEKEILGDHYTMEELMAYSYNAQKPLELQLKEPGTVLLNGEKFPAERVVYNILKPLKKIQEKYYLFPPPFPEEFKLEIASDEYVKDLTFKRVSNKSIYISKYESTSDDSLRFNYEMDDRNLTIKFQISYDLQCAKSIRDIVETLSIYDAFCKGTGSFCGAKIPERHDVSDIKMIDERLIEFWKKVLEVETILKQKFIPPKEDLEFSMISTVETLYQNLVLKNPIRSKNRIDSVSGLWKKEIDGKIRDSVNQELCFEYQAVGKAQLFGKNIELPCLCITYNSKIVQYEIDEEKKEYILYFDDIDKENKMYVSSMWFASKRELEKFIHENKTRISEFENTKPIEEYLKKDFILKI